MMNESKLTRVVYLACALLLCGCFDCSNIGAGSETKALEIARGFDSRQFEVLFRQIEQLKSKVVFNNGVALPFLKNAQGDFPSIPEELSYLKAEKIRIEGNEAYIMLWMCVDTGVDLTFEGLEEENKMIKLSWGDGYDGGSETLWTNPKQSGINSFSRFTP